MKKIILTVLFLYLSTNTARAYFLIPYIDFYFTVNSTPVDSTFDFKVIGSYPVNYNENFSIQTTGGTGSYFFETTTSNGVFFDLRWLEKEGWSLDAVLCTSTNPQITTTSSNAGIGIFAYPYSSVYCSFNISQGVKKAPVLLIPGTLGTEIFKGSEKLWPDVDRMTGVVHQSDSFMDPLAFKTDATPLDTSLTLGSVIGRVVPDFDYTKHLIDDLNTLGYQNNDINLFAYDWRDEIGKNADVDLKSKIDSIYAANGNSKIDIVAHSQGGLLIKKLLFDFPDYENKVNKLIFVGIPNLGAPKSLKILFYGDSLGVEKWKIGLDPQEIKKISQNMPAIYEMLPSRSYFDHSTGYMSEIDHGLRKNYNNFDDTKTALKKSTYSLNSNLIDLSDNFHNSAYDNMDFSSGSMDVYNIVGCASPTIGHIIGNSGGNKLDLDYTPGDGTVPLFSASNILGAKTFFVLDSAEIHGTMLTKDAPREKIVNILNNKTDSVQNLTSNPALCEFEGMKVSVHSPVNLDAYDEIGNHIGFLPDGNFENEIPGSQFDVLGHEKFMFLPKGHIYKIKLTATDSGSFDFYSEKIQGDSTLSTAYYDSVPVTSTSTAEVILNEGNNQVINFTSDSRVVQPSSILNESQSQDLIPPVSTSTLGGLMGKEGFYRSNVGLVLGAEDVVVVGQENETSGVLKFDYKIDNNEWQSVLATSSNFSLNFSLEAEGKHEISFFTTDKAGNSEQPKTISFVIDKTAPEISIQFNPSTKDLEFTGTDEFSHASSTTSILDNGNVITAQDSAGNETVLSLKDKNRKKALNAEIKSLSYNGQTIDISKTALKFNWEFSKNGSLKNLDQHVKSKKDFNIEAEYEKGITKLEGKDQSGKIYKTLNGLVLLKAKTNRGDFDWGY